MGADGDREVNHTTSTHPPDEVDDLCEFSVCGLPLGGEVCGPPCRGSPHTPPGVPTRCRVRQWTLVHLDVMTNIQRCGMAKNSVLSGDLFSGCGWCIMEHVGTTTQIERQKHVTYHQPDRSILLPHLPG
jgi:hypothetical protein